MEPKMNFNSDQLFSNKICKLFKISIPKIILQNLPLINLLTGLKMKKIDLMVSDLKFKQMKTMFTTKEMSQKNLPMKLTGLPKELLVL